ncbi:MAG TPA: hypothetical protein VGA85_07940 [Dehalococcoidales bacterium]
MTSPSMFRGLHGQRRAQLLKIHCLLEFEKIFDEYLAGKVPAYLVTIRAKKMLQCGLPRLK